MKRCIYCLCELHDDRTIDVCDKCGHGVWGTKMFGAIKHNMEKAREKGDL